MYSRDIFPKYSSGGLPIPENYSGNAIRRATPPTSAPPRHTPTPNASPRAAVPLTVSPSFGTRQSQPSAPPQAETPIQPASAPTEEVVRESMAAEQESERPIAEREKEGEPISVSAEARDGGLSSLLSHFLPPKTGGGILSQIGLEEALLLGIILLLSQSEEEQDTLLLLALLFLYR